METLLTRTASFADCGICSVAFDSRFTLSKKSYMVFFTLHRCKFNKKLKLHNKICRISISAACNDLLLNINKFCFYK